MSIAAAEALIEATGLTEWSHFTERCPHLADNEEAKAIFMCGFAKGASWAVSLEFVEDKEKKRG